MLGKVFVDFFIISCEYIIAENSTYVLVNAVAGELYSYDIFTEADNQVSSYGA